MSNNLQARLAGNLLINKSFQLRFLGYFIGLFVINSLSLYACIHLFFWNLRSKALGVGIPDGHVFFSYINNQKYDLDLFFVGLVIFNLVLLVVAGLFISHRIAGPLHKLNRHLSEFTPDSPEFKLRKNDFFRELEGPVNNVKNRLR